MRFKLLLFSCLLLPLLTAASAQDTLLKKIIDVLEIEDENFDLSDLNIQLEHLRKKPIDLNKATREDLQQLILLSPLQISSILNYREKNGEFTTLFELQSIKNIQLDDINFILPFITVNKQLDDLKLNSLLNNNQHKLSIRHSYPLETAIGYNKNIGSKYQGSKNKILMRYSFAGNKYFSMNITLEKDPGERLFTKSKILDHTSGNITIQNLNRFNKIIIGDYTTQFGQGLTLWTGFAMGKSIEMIGLVKNETGIKAYSSVNEYNYFRGIGMDLQIIKNLNSVFFYSNRNLDAKIDTVLNHKFTTNILTSGLHRTQNEINNANTLNNQVFGNVIRYTNKDLNISLINYFNKFEHTIIPAKPIYNQYDYNGNDLINSGLAYGYSLKNLYIFGEISKSLPGGFAYLNGLLINLSSTLSISLLHRKYPINYYSFNNNTISESANAQNETGLLYNLNFQFNKKLKLIFSLDDFKFPWLKYRVNNPNNGHTYQSSFYYTPNKLVKFHFNFRSTYKPQNEEITSNILGVTHYNKNQFKLQYSNDKINNLGFQTSVYLTTYAKEKIKENGFALLQDFNYLLGKSFAGNIRLAYLKTTFNSRIYAYEQDVLHAGGFNMYNGQGLRLYKNLKIRLFNNLNFYTKYSVTIFKNTNSVGSGLDEINSNKKQEVKMQMTFNF